MGIPSFLNGAYGGWNTNFVTISALSFPMSKILDLYKRLPGFLKNKYFLTTIVFAVWMLFLDDYNMIFQYKRGKELRALNEKREFYIKEIEKAEKEKKELFSNADNLEKYARENYFMKRDNEDIFVIEEDSISK